MTTETKPHVHHIRQAVMMTLAVYAHANDEVHDSSMIAALAACLCDALIIRGHELDEATIDVIRKTYEVCALQHAMQEKQGETVQ